MNYYNINEFAINYFVKWKYLIIVFLAALAAFIFFKGLGNQTLQPWDEAWYAVIARNIIQKKDIVRLSFNGEAFWDHPPLGIYLMSLSYLIFGVNEFSTRLPSAILGLLSVVFIYLLGRKIKNNWVGLAAALILISCRWFILRVRSGNLDSLLVFSQILTIYLLYKAKNFKMVWWGVFVWGLSMLSKSVISVCLLPLMISTNWGFIKKNLIKIVLALTPLFTWYLTNTFLYGQPYLLRNIFVTGMKNASATGFGLASISQVLLYFRSAVNKWYLPCLVSVLLALIFSKKNYSIRYILFYLILTATPFLLSVKTQVWHLLPVIPAMALLIALVSYELVIWVKVSRWKNIVYLSVFVLICFYSLYTYKDEIFLPKTISNEAVLAIESNKFKLQLVVLDDTYLPAIVFYAGKDVEVLRDDTRYTVKDKKAPYLVISDKGFFNSLGIKYTLLKSVNGGILGLVE